MLVDVAALPLAAPTIAAGNRCSKTLSGGRRVRGRGFRPRSNRARELGAGREEIGVDKEGQGQDSAVEQATHSTGCAE